MESWNASCLSGNDFVACYPKFNDDYTSLIYFASTQKFLSTSTCFELKKVNFENPNENSIVIPQIRTCEEKFSGIYGYQQPFKDACFVNKSNEFVYTTSNRGNMLIMKVNVDNGH